MGKHVDLETVNRRGLLRRYAALRGITLEQAERTTRTWSRSEFRDILETSEAVELEEPGGAHARWTGGQTTTVQGLTR